MKNFKTLTATSLMALSLVTFNTASADSNLLKMNLNVNGNAGVAERQDEHADVRANLHAQVGVQTGRESDKNENRGNRQNDGRGDQDNRGHDSNGTSTATTSSFNENHARGVLQAPGIEKRIESGKGMPFGLREWFKWFFGNGTTTPPSAPLNIHDVSVNSGTSTAAISWKTNASTTSELRYATTTSVVQGMLVSDSSLGTTHSVSLVGLTPDTKYYFTITSKDANGNVKTSILMKLDTKPLPVDDTRAPSIIFTTSLDVSSSSARLVWVTDEKADSRVWISGTSSVNTLASTTVSLSDLVFVHSVTVSGLATSTEYHYVVGGADASGNVSTSTIGAFTTTH